MTDTSRYADDETTDYHEQPAPLQRTNVTAEKTLATMSMRADAVRQHREHGGNGPEMSDAAQQTTQSAIARIKTLFRVDEAA